MAIKKKKVSEMPLVGSINDFEVMGVDKSTNRSAKANMEQLRGNVGPTPDITFSVHTVEYGQTPTVESTGTPENPQVAIGLPKGQDGEEVVLRKGASGIEWKYTSDAEWQLLITTDELKLHFADLAPEDIAELQRPAAEAAEVANNQAAYAKDQGDYAKEQADRISVQIGTPGGVAELDASGHVPSSQLPSYVDDVEEYASRPSFPATGQTGKIYVALDTNLTWRWGGTDYVEISPSLALGNTSSTAFAGDRGVTLEVSVANIVDGTTAVGHALKADTATKAQQDGNGDIIAETYLKQLPASYSPITDENSGHASKKLWTGTEEQYASLTSYDGNTLYIVVKPSRNEHN